MIRRDDEGVSDIVGTILLLGITVAIVGVAVAGFYSAAGNQHTAVPRLDMKLSATPSGAANGTLLLTHSGGAPFNRTDLDVIVTSGSTTYGRVSLPGNGTWDIGQSVPVPLTLPLAGGEHLEIQVVSRALGSIVSDGIVDVAEPTASAPAPGTFTITMKQPAVGNVTDVAAGSALHVIAHVDHPDGRKAIAAVWIDLSNVQGAAVSPLYDDGTRGDVTAGDLDFATYVLLPPEATPSPTPITLPVMALDIDGNGAPAAASANVVIHVIPPGYIVNGDLTNLTISNLTSLSGGSTTNNNGSSSGGGSTFSNVSVTNLTYFYGDNVTNVQFGSDGADGTPGAPGANGSDGSGTVIDYINISTFDVTNLTNVSFAGNTTIEQLSITDLSNSTFEGNTTLQNVTNLTNATFAGNTTVDSVTLVTNVTNATELQSLSFLGNVTNLTIVSQGGATGPPELTEPGPFSPTSGAGGTLVSVFGKNFSFVNSVRLVAGPGAPLGVTWWLIDDTRLEFIAPVTSAPGDHAVTVTNPVGSDTSIETFHLLAASNVPSAAPKITSMTPTHGFGGDEITLRGENLSYITAVRLTAGSNVFPAAFYVVAPDGTESHFFVPQGAPATTYTVSASGAGGSVDAPVPFTIDPRAPFNALTIADINPKVGPAFTRIDINGTGFLGVVAANVGGANVALWVVNDTNMSILTHPGVPVQRFNHITLYNQTGSVEACCFEELPTITNEYADYPTNMLARFAFNMTKFLSNDSVGVAAKFNMTNYTFVSNGETFTFNSVTFETPNFKPGSAITDTNVLRTTTSGTNKVVCSPSGAVKNGIWLMYFTQAPKKYSAGSDTLPFLFWFEWTGSLGHTFDVSIGSSFTQEDFTLGPESLTKIVKDGPNYDWPSSFTDCTATP